MGLALFIEDIVGVVDLVGLDQQTVVVRALLEMHYKFM